MKTIEPSLGLAIRYEWVEASIPPPDHYEWTIEIQGQQGKITFYPDYPQPDVTPWVRSFSVTKGQINRLYEVFHSSRVFRTHWQEPGETSVGGAHENMTVWLDGQTFRVPSQRTAGASRALQPVWKALRACVPPAIWDQLLALREAAIQKQSGFGEDTSLAGA